MFMSETQKRLVRLIRETRALPKQNRLLQLSDDDSHDLMYDFYAMAWEFRSFATKDYMADIAKLTIEQFEDTLRKNQMTLTFRGIEIEWFCGSVGYLVDRPKP